MFLWLALGLAGAYWWWKSAHRYPTIDPTADALTLLNFTPYTLRPALGPGGPQGRETYRYVLAPEGLPAAQVANALGNTVNLIRKHIPIPGPTTVTAFADLWAVQGLYAGPVRTITPSTLLQDEGIPALASNVDPARQLAAMLYAAALNPTTTGKLVLIPIAAKQA